MGTLFCANEEVFELCWKVLPQNWLITNQDFHLLQEMVRYPTHVLRAYILLPPVA